MSSSENERVISGFLLGNRQAVEFVSMFVSILHLWDDLVDKDKPLADADINSAMFKVMVTLPRNTFYSANFNTLNPIMLMAILSWIGATKIERSTTDEHELHVALQSRAQYADIVLVCAALVGGYEYAAGIADKVILWTHSERYEDYVKSLAAEKSAREGE